MSGLGFRAHLLTTCMLAAALSTQAWSAPVTYRVSLIGVGNVDGYAMTRKGVVAGQLNEQAAIFDHRDITLLALPEGAVDARAAGVKDAGHAAGSASLWSGGPLHAFVWTGGSGIDLGLRFGQQQEWSQAVAIGAHDVVLVNDHYGDFGGGAYLWKKGHMSDLPTPEGMAVLTAAALNSLGHVAGVALDANRYSYGFFYRDGQTSLIGNNLQPLGINVQ